MPEPTDPRDAKSLQLVRLYREQLREILTLAEHESLPGQLEARRRVAALVDELTRDIIGFYDRGGPETLTVLQRTAVLPALQRLRDILRNSKASRRALRDTLLKATEPGFLLENRIP